MLGPLLFLLYINDISNCSDLGIYVLFADDTNIFVEGKTVSEVFEKTNRLLKSVNRYMLLNKLHINTSKCCFIHFKPQSYHDGKQDTEPPKLLIDNFPIKKLSHAKFLGVIIDEKLSWEQHILDLKRKLSYATYTLNHIKDNLPKELHKDLYHTLFESHLAYCISVWGGCSKTKLLPIWNAQKHCIRVLFGDKTAYLDKFMTCARSRPYGNEELGPAFFEREHSKPLFKENSILSMNNLYSYHCFMELLKILKLRYPTAIYEKFNTSERKPTLLLLNSPSNCFTHRSALIWNILAHKLGIFDYSVKINTTRNLLKQALLKRQHAEETIEWTSEDHNLARIIVQISAYPVLEAN